MMELKKSPMDAKTSRLNFGGRRGYSHSVKVYSS